MEPISTYYTAKHVVGRGEWIRTTDFMVPNHAR